MSADNLRPDRSFKLFVQISSSITPCTANKAPEVTKYRTHAEAQAEHHANPILHSVSLMSSSSRETTQYLVNILSEHSQFL